MPPVYAHELVREYRLYFLNGSHFSQFLFVALLTTWLKLESSYLAQLCIYTGATHTQEIMQLWTIFLKLLIFWKIHISHFVSPCIMYFEIHITMNSFCVACIYAYFNGNCFIGIFGIYANEPMQSWIVCDMASLSVDSFCSHRFDHRNFISCIYVYICPLYMHMHKLVDTTCIFKMAAILANFFLWLSWLHG